MEFDPVSLTLDEMLQMDSHALHQMARISAGTLTRYRALLGRLLLAIGRTDAHLELGCSALVTRKSRSSTRQYLAGHPPHYFLRRRGPDCAREPDHSVYKMP